MTVTETGNIAMPLELSDLVAHNDGDEEEDKQLVSQWMCDIYRDFTAPQFSNPVVTQCFLCNAFLCKSCAQNWRAVVNGLMCPRTVSLCAPCWIRYTVSDSDEGSDSGCSDGSRSRSRSPSSRSRSRTPLPRYR